MTITEDFGDVPRELQRPGSPSHRVRDTFAIWWLHHLIHSVHNSPPDTYGRSTWGFTVLRTIYTEESDTLFPAAIEALERMMKQYYVHMNRFPWWSERGEQIQKKDGSANEEVARRFRLEVLEDKDKLNFPKLTGISYSTMKSLVDYFNEWVISVGGDPTDKYPANPRLAGCLFVDSEVLDLLTELSKQEIPPLRAALDREEKRKWLGQSYAWIWFLDARQFGSYREEEEDPKFRGWGKLDASDIPDCWFRKAGRFSKDYWMLECEKIDENGDFFLE